MKTYLPLFNSLVCHLLTKDKNLQYSLARWAPSHLEGSWDEVKSMGLSSCLWPFRANPLSLKGFSFTELLQTLQLRLKKFLCCLKALHTYLWHITLVGVSQITVIVYQFNFLVVQSFADGMNLICHCCTTSTHTNCHIARVEWMLSTLTEFQFLGKPQ